MPGSPLMGGYLARLMSPRGGRGNERVRPGRTNRKSQRDRLQPGAASSGSCDHLGRSSQDGTCQRGCELARKPGDAREPNPVADTPVRASRAAPCPGAARDVDRAEQRGHSARAPRERPTVPADPARLGIRSREQLLSQPDVARAGRCREEFAIGHRPQHQRQPDRDFIASHVDHHPFDRGIRDCGPDSLPPAVRAPRTVGTTASSPVAAPPVTALLLPHGSQPGNAGELPGSRAPGSELMVSIQAVDLVTRPAALTLASCTRSSAWLQQTGLGSGQRAGGDKEAVRFEPRSLRVRRRGGQVSA